MASFRNLARSLALDSQAIGARWLATGAFLVVISLLTVFCCACLAVLGSARAYSESEARFRGAQKNAVILLQDYLDSRNERDFDAAMDSLAVPLAAHSAREFIFGERLDYEKARQALLADGDDPADARAMIWVGRLTRFSRRVDAILAACQAADAEVARLQLLSRQIHREVLAAALTDQQRRDFALQLFQLNDRLDALENAFARELAEGARATQSALIFATLALTIFLIVTRLLFMRMMTQRLSRSNESLSEGNARWGLAARASKLGLLDWRPDTDTTLLDDRAREMFGLADAGSGFIDADAIRQRIHEDDRHQLRAASEFAMADLGSTTRRFRVRRSGGEIRTLEMSARAFSYVSGKPSHLIGLVRDVTSDVDAERMRTQEIAIAQANQLKSKFFSQVSHELRTPLNAILRFSEVIRDDEVSPLSTAQRARLDRVIDGGQYLLRLVNDLLDRASLEEGRLSVVMQSVALRDVVTSALTMLEPTQALRRIALDVDLPPHDLRVQADPLRLKQVIVNIMSNAIKYNRDDGTVHFRCVSLPESVSFSVRDEGIGLNESQQKELFVPFHRLGAEASSTEGAGLGLVITRHLVERQGGMLTVESKPGHGTTVTVQLKGAREATVSVDAQQRTGSANLPTEKSGVVLYIEDDPVNVILLEEYLRAWTRVRLLIARDGKSGIECACANLPDLVVLDMQLPDMTGIAVLQALKSRPATRNVPVVALSASAMGDENIEAMQLGVEDYLTKPISRDRLRNEVAKYLH